MFVNAHGCLLRRPSGGMTFGLAPALPCLGNYLDMGRSARRLPFYGGSEVSLSLLEMSMVR